MMAIIKPPRRRPWIIFCAIGACFVAMLVSAVWTYGSLKKEMTIANNANWKGRYTGLGLDDSESFWGYRFIDFTITSPYERAIITPTLESDVWHCEIYSVSGPLRIRGTIPTEGSGPTKFPLIGYWIDAVSYAADGKETGRVIDGDGNLIVLDDAGSVLGNWIFVDSVLQRESLPELNK